MLCDLANGKCGGHHIQSTIPHKASAAPTNLTWSRGSLGDFAEGSYQCALEFALHIFQDLEGLSRVYVFLV